MGIPSFIFGIRVIIQVLNIFQFLELQHTGFKYFIVSLDTAYININRDSFSILESQTIVQI